MNKNLEIALIRYPKTPSLEEIKQYLERCPNKTGFTLIEWEIHDQLDYLWSTPEEQWTLFCPKVEVVVYVWHSPVQEDLVLPLGRMRRFFATKGGGRNE